MSIALLILAKNEEHCIHLPILSAKNYVNRVIVVDDKSKDKTTSIATALGADIIRNKIRPRKKGFSEVFNWAISQMSEDWILILDADEFLDKPHLIHDLQRFQDVTAWALPRRKWYDYGNGQRMEFEAYPDWQPRFFRNIPENRFEGELHKVFKGNLRKAYRGPHIEHLQEELTTKIKRKYRKDLYKHLGEVQGVFVERGNKRSF